MSQLDATKTTIGDMVQAALKESGAIGQGQTASAEDANDAWARAQWMIQQWERKFYLVYHLVTYSQVSSGAQFYTVGPGGTFNTSAAASPFNPQFNPQFGTGDVAGADSGVSARPQKLESAYLRQISNLQAPNQVDFYLEILPSMVDYNRIRLKQLASFPTSIFYDPAWPLGLVYPWPVPQANIYQIFLTFREQLPVQFKTLASQVFLPYEYYAAILYNLALRLRPKYGIPTPPGDQLKALAKESLDVLRQSNSAIAELQMPGALQRGKAYNIFGDTFN
jgi:hypothetical protein